MTVVKKHMRRTSKGRITVKKHGRKVRKKGKYFHPKGKIIIENRPVDKGYKEILSEDMIKSWLKEVPKKDLALIKRIRTKNIGEYGGGYVPIQAPREITLGHIKDNKDGSFIIGRSPGETLLHEIGHIKSGHMTKDNVKKYHEKKQEFLNMEIEADNYARDIIQKSHE